MIESDFQQLKRLLTEKEGTATEPIVPWKLGKGAKVVEWNVREPSRDGSRYFFIKSVVEQGSKKYCMNNPAPEYWAGNQIGRGGRIKLPNMGYEYMRTQYLKARGLL